MSVEENKAVVRAFIEVWNSGTLDRLDDLMAEECVLTVSGETISCSPSATRAIEGMIDRLVAFVWRNRTSRAHNR